MKKAAPERTALARPLYGGGYMMSNEEMARRIQEGETELLPTLWEQVHRFIYREARRRYCATSRMRGVEIDDLIQSGYIALVEAVAHFKPDVEYTFLTYLGRTLKTAFAETCGYKTSKCDPLNAADSLDAPLTDDTDTTKGDMLADPVDQYEDAERRIWLEQLQKAMGKAMDKLPPEWRDVLRRYYWQGQTLEEISAATGIHRNNVNNRRNKGLRQLRRNISRYGLDQFVEDRTPYYARVGVESFNATHTSAVELAAIRREALERIYDRQL